MKLLILHSISIACAIILGSCASVPQDEAVQLTSQIARSTKRFKKQYIIAPGDKLEIHVVGNTEVSRSIMVRPDGKISLPFLGDVQASGRTFPGLGKELEKKFSVRLTNPEVSVIALDVRQPMIYVMGDVVAPRALALREVQTAAQAIGLVGGYKRDASQKDIALIRLEDNGQLVARNIGRIVGGRNGNLLSLQQVILRPDDIIFVPEGKRSKSKRFITDFINTPLSGVNSMLQTYAQFVLIDALVEQNDD